MTTKTTKNPTTHFFPDLIARGVIKDSHKNTAIFTDADAWEEYPDTHYLLTNSIESFLEEYPTAREAVACGHTMSFNNGGMAVFKFSFEKRGDEGPLYITIAIGIYRPHHELSVRSNVNKIAGGHASLQRLTFYIEESELDQFIKNYSLNN